MASPARVLAAVGLTLTLAACETTPAPSAEPAFNAAAFTWSTARGRGQINGRLVHTARGVTYSCQGAGAVLTPETPWVRRRMQSLYGSTEKAVEPVAAVRQRMPAGSPNYDAYVRRSPCDAQGRFSFGGLPDGAWYLITSGMPSPSGAQLAFMRRVVIRGGAAVEVSL